jgi:hypothetical protein
MSKKVKDEISIGEILIYKSKEGPKLEVRLQEDTVWLDAHLMAKLFGLENCEKFKAIIGNIYQTFGGADLYPSLEEKAAHLLYFIIKDHPFIDESINKLKLFFEIIYLPFLLFDEIYINFVS